MNHDVAEVNGSDPPTLPGSFLYEKEPGYEAMLAHAKPHWSIVDDVMSASAELLLFKYKGCQ